ncbi:SUMO1 sentrin specific peptidase 8 [Entomophthora muscae]|nr:SUMO1 sentrin specific peptidase 8 [Entomophthora muscae]
MNLKKLFKMSSPIQSKDPIQVSYYDSVLRKSDIESVNEGNWLTDAVITFFYTYLEQSPSNTGLHGILLLEPSMIHLLRQSTYPASLQGVLPNALYDANYVFLPVNDHLSHTAGGNHWSLLVYSRPNSSFFYYDSYNNSNYHHAKNTAECFIHFLGLPPSTLRVMPTPQQKNGNDCGVFVISLSESLFHAIIATPTATSTHMPIPVPPNQIWTIEPTRVYPASVQRARIKNIIKSLRKG